MTLRTAGLALAALLVASGCGGKPPPPPLVTVNGKLVHKQEPVPLVLLTFVPTDPRSGVRPQAASQPDGTFTLQCPPGSYKVTLAPVPQAGAAPPGDAAPLADPAKPGRLRAIPAAYRDPDNTPLRVEVPDGGKDGVVLEVQ
jgi:hypothetical protein